LTKQLPGNSKYVIGNCYEVWKGNLSGNIGKLKVRSRKVWISLGK
jgi:hypothetical protein